MKSPKLASIFKPLPLLFTLGVPAMAQDSIQPEFPSSPTGFSDSPRSPDISWMDEPDSTDAIADLGNWLSDFNFSSLASLYYDSNASQAPDTAAYPANDDWILRLNQSVNWSRDARLWSLSLGGTVGYNQYFTESDFSGMNYSSRAAYSYDAGRLNIGTNAQQSFSQGVNRYASADSGNTENQTLSFGLNLNYDLSPKTDLSASFGSSWSDPKTDGPARSVSTESSSANLAAIWKYSPLLQFGPGIRYSTSTSDGSGQQDQTTLGPTLTTRYQLSRKIGISSLVGLNYVEYSETSGSEPSLFLQTSANYAINRIWGANLSITKNSQADGYTPGAFRDTTATRFSITHHLRRTTSSIGLGYESSDYDFPGGTSTRPSQDHLTLDGVLSMPVIGDRANASFFIRYLNNSSDSITEDWKSVQVGTSLQYNF